ncbi:MAG: M28 family peptidase [Muribaculaceae bacterium]|nr:M28 family peptidase [Muribaculaceae bacterium]
MLSVRMCAAAAAFAIASAGCSKPARQAETATSHSDGEPQFSADSAFTYLARQVAFGPRVANSAAHEACASWIASELARHGADTVIVQRADIEGFGPAANIMGRFNAGAARRVLLLAHWDSRPWADEDPDPANHARPIDGANDGASGVAVLLEMARLMGRELPTVGVDLLFVDAEDAGSAGDDDSWALGTQYWVEHMPYGVSEPMPDYAVLLDMVGGTGATFPRELFSDVNCRPLTARIWSLARKIGLAERFPDVTGGAVNDDHIPLIRAGIPAVDIIETNNPQTGSFNPTWHTMADNIENIDPAALGDAGKLVTTLIYSEK